MCTNRTLFDKLIDRVTRPNIVEGKRELKRKLLEMIRKGDVEPEHALSSITAKMASADPVIAIISIDILDSWVMICDRLIQDEIVSVRYMNELKELLDKTSNMKIKLEILHLIQDWSQTLGDPIITETVEILKAEGYEFPSERDEFSNSEELQLQDNNTCQRCSTIFAFYDKQNCEVCGKTFCSDCLINRNDEHEIVNLVCENCEQLIFRNQSENNSSGFSQNEGRDTNKFIAVLEGDDDEDLCLAMALSESELVADKSNVSCLESESHYTAPECSICCEHRVNSMLHPCSHLCMCYDCASKQWKGVGNGCCPICRIPIEDVTQIK